MQLAQPERFENQEVERSLQAWLPGTIAIDAAERVSLVHGTTTARIVALRDSVRCDSPLLLRSSIHECTTR